MSFAAVSVILACLLIIGSFTLLSMNIDMIVSEAESSTEIIAFVDENCPYLRREASDQE